MNKYDTRNPETQIHIFETTCPDERQTDDIMQLVRLCQLHDGISISCPLDPDDPARHFLRSLPLHQLRPYKFFPYFARFPLLFLLFYAIIFM